KIASGDTTSSCSLTGGIRPCVNLGAYDALGYTSYRQKINIDEVEIRGLEVAGRYLLGDRWTLSANYTWTDSEQLSGPNAGQPLTNTAEHMVNGTLDWAMLDNLTLSLQVEMRSDRYRGWDSVLNAPQYYKNHELWNLGLRYKVTDRLTLFGRVNNLLDEDFTTYDVDFVDIDGDGRYCSVGCVENEVIYTDHYNIMAASRNFWFSVQMTF